MSSFSGCTCSKADEVREEMTDHVSVYTPIGHAGAPLPHDYFQETGCVRSSKCEFLKIASGGYCGEDMMSQLPQEIKLQITGRLLQHDLVNVARVWSAFSDAALTSLYAKVTVDPHHSYLGDESAAECDTATYIKTSYNLKRFMRLITRKKGSEKSVGELVKSFKVVQLPDGMGQSEFRALVCETLPAMSGLTQFYCRSEGMSLPIEVLQRMPNRHELESLAVNVDLKHALGEIGSFENIRKLSVSPFYDSNKLASLLSQILVPDVIENLKTLRMARDGPSLINKSTGQSLVVTGFMLNNNVSQPELEEGDASVGFNQMDLQFWSFLDRVTNRGSRFRSLTSLEIEDVDVTPEDSHRVARGVALENLEFLSLANVRDVHVVRAVDYEVRDFTSLALEHLRPSFICGIAPQLHRLRKLKLDYHEPIRDSGCEFLQLLKSDAHVTLEELDITIHWDDSKLALWPSWEALARNYVAAILLHRNSLRKLSLLASHDSKFYERPKRIPAPLLAQLSACANLHSLRLHGESLLAPAGPVSLVPALHQLRNLDLVGKTAPQHMGLMVVHDGVLDSWYRVIHVAIALARANPALRLVRIEKCLFDCRENGTVVPKTSDDSGSWFDNHTRVLMSPHDF